MDQPKDSKVRGALFLIGLFAVVVVLYGLGASCFRLAGRNIDDAIRLG